MNLNHADTDTLLQGVIYGYCVKYNRLIELINANFAGSSATTIDIFVDIHDIYKHTISFMKMKDFLVEISIGQSSKSFLVILKKKNLIF